MKKFILGILLISGLALSSTFGPQSFEVAKVSHVQQLFAQIHKII
ncbi:hypothetical protein [Cytobacillus praedii]|nr:hypothetical protein [Cytobacillus praedii]